jgi:23S rRNA G2445 N2-methylase RlmL
MKLSTSMSFFASCPVLLEDLLEQELITHDAKIVEKVHGGVLFKSNIVVAFNVMLYSRIASRIYLGLAHFKFRELSEMQEAIKKVWLDKYLELNQTFKITTIVERGTALADSPDFINLKAKDAICDFYTDKYQRRPSVNKENPHQQFLLHLSENQQFLEAKFYIDLCGTPLSHRGYRQNGHEAPMRENLAAAIVLLSGWKPAEESFIDGMSGSGTFLIEAALYAANVGPSFKRLRSRMPFTLLAQPWFVEHKEISQKILGIMEETKEKNIEKIKNLKVEIIGIEKSPHNVELLKQHLEMMKLSDKVKVVQGDFLAKKYEAKKNGVLVLNPPYGHRLEEENLEELYYQIGETFKKNYTGFRSYLFTARHDLRKKISLKTSKKIPLRSGNLDCRLLEYLMR